MNFDFWENAPLDWLDYDKDAPDRKWVAEYIDKHKQPGWTMTEIGFGTGIDYERYFSKIDIQYTGVDGCANFVKHANEKFPKTNWIYSKDPWKVAPANIVYTRATLEHQPDFKQPLIDLLSYAENLAIVTWYLPPAEKSLLYVEREHMYYNRYSHNDVVDTVKSCGFDFIIYPILGEKDMWPINGKDVWVCQNNKANTKK